MGDALFESWQSTGTHLAEEAVVLGHEVLWPDVVQVPLETLALQSLPEFKPRPDTLTVPQKGCTCNRETRDQQVTQRLGMCPADTASVR